VTYFLELTVSNPSIFAALGVEDPDRARQQIIDRPGRETHADRQLLRDGDAVGDQGQQFMLPRAQLIEQITHIPGTLLSPRGPPADYRIIMAINDLKGSVFRYAQVTDDVQDQWPFPGKLKSEARPIACCGYTSAA